MRENIVIAKTPGTGFIHPRFSIAARRFVALEPEVLSMKAISSSSRAAGAAIASLLLMSSAFAQTTAPATPAPAPKMAPAEKKAEKPRTAASVECSKEADAKALHGKERKKFRSECMKTAADKAK